MSTKTNISATFDLPFPNSIAKREAFLRALMPTFDAIQKDALEKVIRNTPIRTGALRKSLFVNINVNISDGVVSFDFGSDLDYALAEHERDHQLGPISAAQAGTPEGGVGKKYFTRVIDRWADTWADWLTDAIYKYFDKELQLK